MPVYNGGKYLIDAVASIVEQSYTDWELIAINDGSTDSSGDVLDWLRHQDSRIQVCHQANGGIVRALNTGCRLARGDLICRMDCDDVALSDRLEKQVAFLNANTSCVVLGGGILEIDQENRPLSLSHLAKQHDDIVAGLMTRKTGHFHPTTLFRRDAFEKAGRYRKRYEWVEDHDLWLRMSEQGELANLTDILLCYRQHSSSVCWQRSETQRELINQLLAERYQEVGHGQRRSAVASQSKQRAASGPGKLARIAAKGGFATSALQLLGEMWAGRAATSYKLRMTAEVALRLPGSIGKRVLQTTPTVPQFPDWHYRYSTAPAAHRPLAA
jgi:glycosyltransferase involved in cell wall biosynthesis